VEARELRIFTLVGALSSGACGTTPPPEPVTAPVVLAQRCRVGVTGQIDDQYAAAVAGVTCLTRSLEGESSRGVSDGRGVFFIDRLTALPREIRFEKPGFVSQTLAVAAPAPGAAARVFVTLRRIADAECTCEPSALISGLEPCPADKCGGTQDQPDPSAAPPMPAEAPPPP
jgi:hypothetical protein